MESMRVSKQILLNTEIPGPKSRALRSKEDQLLAPGLQGFALNSGIVVERAKGSIIEDIDGNKFIDLIGGIGVNGLGHSHPKYIQALTDQLEKVSVGSFTSQVRVDLLERITAHAPKLQNHTDSKLNRLQLYSSGAEAVESSLRLAKCHTGKTEFVSFWGGFHGKTLATMALNGGDLKQSFGPMPSGFHQIPYANCYRCPLKLKPESCSIDCVDLGRKQLKAASTGNIAAFIVEPMQGTSGNIVPPKEFLPAVKNLANEFNALLIADEMITGFGRTGHYWGIEDSQTIPDMITIGKQFGGGFPVSGVLTNSEISNAKPWSNPSGSSSSYGGNPLAAAAANAALRIIDEEQLVENSRQMGAYFLKKLMPFTERYPFVGKVSGKGLFLGIELVENKETKIPLKKELCQKIFSECVKRGLLTMSYSASFRIQPAMTIDEATIDESVSTLQEVFDRLRDSL